MQRVYTAQSELEAHEARLFLESHGIRAIVDGESAAFTNLSFTPGSEPGILVDDVDAERSAELLRNHLAARPVAAARGDWRCPKCGEVCGDAFEVCWNCDEPRSSDAVAVAAEPLDERPAAPFASTPVEAPTDSRVVSPSNVRAWAEVIFLLVITIPWPARDRLYEFFGRGWSTHSFASLGAYWALIEMFWASCALAIIWQSREPWSQFGIRRVSLLRDLFGAGILTILTMFAVSMSNGLFLDFAREQLTPDHFQYLFHESRERLQPHGLFDAIVLLGFCLCVGFAEELIYRGILIPRFVQLLRSTFFAVLTSSALFAAFHWHQGVLSTWNALGMGLLFGTAFAKFRNLWPLVFAHALLDFAVFLYHGSN